MLVLTRRPGESIVIGDGIKLTVVTVGPGRVKIGIEAPPHVRIDREEIHARIQQEQEQCDRRSGRGPSNGCRKGRQRRAQYDGELGIEHRDSHQSDRRPVAGTPPDRSRPHAAPTVRERHQQVSPAAQAALIDLSGPGARLPGFAFPCLKSLALRVVYPENPIGTPPSRGRWHVRHRTGTRSGRGRAAARRGDFPEMRSRRSTC